MRERFITFKQSDKAFFKVCGDLSSRGYLISIPMGEQHSYDIIIDNGVLKRIQIKHCSLDSNGTIELRNSFYSYYKKNGHFKKVGGYIAGDFDYFAAYIPQLNIIIYPPFSLLGKYIRVLPQKNKCRAFYWYGDFLNFNDSPPIKRCSKELTNDFTNLVARVGHSPTTSPL